MSEESSISLQLTENALKVLKERYLQRGIDEDGKIFEETPEGMFRRVAKAVAAAEKVESQQEYEDKFYNLMASLKFLPNSPTLSGAGTELGQLAACYVLPIQDDMVDIMETARKTVMIHKSGGGTGFNFSNLRPKGSPVKTTNGVAGGPVSFMEMYDQITSKVAQGSVRHGANMGILDWDHPDLEQFIHCKQNDGDIHNFNISVNMPNDVMEEIIEDYENGTKSYHRFRQICEAAWATGDPGLVFLDRVNERPESNPVPDLGPIVATNPCGEQPLYEYDACTLGSINLAKYAIKEEARFDEGNLIADVKLAVRFLDDVLSVNRWPIFEASSRAKYIRRIGLGVMGWADALYILEIKYGSKKSIELASHIMKVINKAAKEESNHLGKIKGAYPAQNPNEEPMRNCTVTTIAPTGTISIIAGCSSGIEPVYSLAIKRKHHLNHENLDEITEMVEYNPVFIEHIKSRPEYEHMALMTKPPYYFVTTHDIPWHEHIEMQAAFQEHTDNSVSKTINMPNDATVEDVMAAYLLAYRLGCNGITIYRDGSKQNQVLSEIDKEHLDTRVEEHTSEGELEKLRRELDSIKEHGHVHPERKKLPVTRNSMTHKFEIAGVEGYITAGQYENGSLGEIFVNLDKQSGTISSLVDDICIAVSVGVQYGVPIETFINKYKGQKFEPYGPTVNPQIQKTTSIVDYIFRWIEQMFSKEIKNPSMDLCTQCDEFQLIYEEGCHKCLNCGFSSC